MLDSLLASAGIAPEVLLALCGFALLAGFIDAVVGGGGLIQIPALFVLMPQAAPALVLGTNKFAAIWGTASATWQYARRVPLDWTLLLPAGLAAAAGAFAGARLVSTLGNADLRPLMLLMMVAVLVYTLWKKDFGRLHAPSRTPAAQRVLALAIGGLVGFYDGFFGPGTGSFLIFAFVGLLGFSFLNASASAKAVNTITNLAALALFIAHDQVLFSVAAPMAVANVAGSVLGSRLALARGSGFVRALFIAVVSALIARFGWDIVAG